MNRVLITGASGFVGHHLTDVLHREGVSTMGVGHQAESDIKGDYLQLDLLNDDAVQAFDFTPYDSIIHLAGLAAVGPSYTQPAHYIEANSRMQINLFEACIKQSVTPRVIIVSSGSLYSTDTLPITEAMPLAPSSPYAVSKITQEQLGHYYQGRGFEVIIARPFNHIGPGQLPGFIVPDIAQQIVSVERGAKNHVVVGDLSSKRDYTDVRDIAEAYFQLLQKGVPGETYNICSGTSHSGEELFELLCKASTSAITKQADPERMRPSDLHDIYGSHDKLTRDTGWQPQINLSQTLEETLAYWRARS